MDIGISDINYKYTTATVVFGVLLALIVREGVNWLKTNAGETETH
jgi:hypothetical protein